MESLWLHSKLLDEILSFISGSQRGRKSSRATEAGALRLLNSHFAESVVSYASFVIPFYYRPLTFLKLGIIGSLRLAWHHIIQLLIDYNSNEDQILKVGHSLSIYGSLGSEERSALYSLRGTKNDIPKLDLGKVFEYCESLWFTSHVAKESRDKPVRIISPPLSRVYHYQDDPKDQVDSLALRLRKSSSGDEHFFALGVESSRKIGYFDVLIPDEHLSPKVVVRLVLPSMERFAHIAHATRNAVSKLHCPANIALIVKVALCGCSKNYNYYNKGAPMWGLSLDWDSRNRGGVEQLPKFITRRIGVGWRYDVSRFVLPSKNYGHHWYESADCNGANPHLPIMPDLPVDASSYYDSGYDYSISDEGDPSPHKVSYRRADVVTVRAPKGKVQFAEPPKD